MSEMERILDYTITVEGGYSDRAADRGGPTKYGITIKTWSNYVGRPVTKQEMKDLTIAQAKACYRDLYYAPLNLDRFPVCLRHVVFDMCVNHGQGTAVRLTQKMVNHLRGKEILETDGKIGPKTLAAINDLLKDFKQKDIIEAVCLMREKFYRAIVANDTTGTQIENLNGWLNRNKKFKTNFVVDTKYG